jgi:hypothetical protein
MVDIEIDCRSLLTVMPSLVRLLMRDVQKKHQLRKLVFFQNREFLKAHCFLLNRRDANPIIPNAKTASVDGSGTVASPSN